MISLSVFFSKSYWSRISQLHHASLFKVHAIHYIGKIDILQSSSRFDLAHWSYLMVTHIIESSSVKHSSSGMTVLPTQTQAQTQAQYVRT